MYTFRKGLDLAKVKTTPVPAYLVILLAPS